MKDEAAPTTYSRGYTFHIVGLGLLGGSIALFSKPVLMILSTEPYYIAYSIVFIIIMAYLYRGSNNVLGIGISLSRQTKYISYAQVVAFVVNFGLNFLLIPRFSAWGAALAFAGGVMAQSLAYYYFAQRLYPIPIRFWRLQLFILTLFSIVALQTYIIRDFNLLSSTLTALIFLPALGFLTWKLGLNHEERQKILNLIQHVLTNWKLLRTTN